MSICNRTFRTCLKSHFELNHACRNRVFSSKLGFFLLPQFCRLRSARLTNRTVQTGSKLLLGPVHVVVKRPLTDRSRPIPEMQESSPRRKCYTDSFSTDQTNSEYSVVTQVCRFVTAGALFLVKANPLHPSATPSRIAQTRCPRCMC